MKNLSLNNTFNESFVEIAIDQNVVTTILHILCQILIFCAGLIIQIKIIIACKKGKGKTWQVDILDALVKIVYFSFSIFFDATTHFIPFLSQYTGDGMCYIASTIIFYCFYSILAHSLFISIMKYVFIVQNKRVFQIGEHRVQNWFMWIYLIYPLFLTTSTIMTSDWESYSSLYSCFGNKHALLEIRSNILQYDPKRSSFENIFICKSQWNITCAIQAIVNMVMNSNLLEMLFYYKIFQRIQW